VKYLLLIYGDENALSLDERNACYGDSTQLAHDLVESGHFIATAPLHATSTATSVRVQDGKRIVTDGPFAETREQLGGFFMIEAADLDEAVSIAGRIPGAKWGTVEVRPVVELPNLPAMFDDARPEVTASGQ
jgi:hypothetical protein